MSRIYDFIIVGAGTAGCLLANRLSANGKFSVALIEAGGSDNYHWVHIARIYTHDADSDRWNSTLWRNCRCLHLDDVHGSKSYPSS